MPVADDKGVGAKDDVSSSRNRLLEFLDAPRLARAEGHP
jgi:hypothetical protein